MTTKEPEIIKESQLGGHVDELTFRLMNEKFNKKYESVLNEDQKKIIKLFVEDNTKSKIEVKQLFEEIKEKSVKSLKEYKRSCDNSIILERYNIIENKVSEVNCSDVSEENMKRFLTLCKLNEELKGEKR